MSTKKEKIKEIVQEEEIQKVILDQLDEKAEDPNSETAGGLVISDNGLKSSGDVRLAETNMIQKHVDNFLAKIAGETPVDDKPRNSTEYWLGKIGQYAGGGSTDSASTKKIYWHTVYFKREGEGYWYTDGDVIILNNSPDPITADEFTKLLKIPGFRAVVFNGRIATVAGGDLGNTTANITSIAYRDVEGSMYVYYINDSNHLRGYTDVSLAGVTVIDYGANAIN